MSREKPEELMERKERTYSSGCREKKRKKEKVKNNDKWRALWQRIVIQHRQLRFLKRRPEQKDENYIHMCNRRNVA